MDLKKYAQDLKDKGIDLEKDNSGGFGQLEKPGKYLFSCVGFERYLSSGKGTPALMFRFVVVDGDQIGKTIDCDIYLTSNPIDLMNLALSLGAPEEPFDEHSDEAIGDILNKYFPTVRATAYEDEYQGKTRLKLKYFGKAAADKRSEEFIDQDAQKKAFNDALDGFNKYLEWRTKNPRKAPGSGGGSGGGGQQQTASRNTGNRSGSNAGGQDPDDDIPF